MNNSNTLSIIIPIYNEENSVEETINSILSKISQEVDKNIKIIAVNDGSTDRTSNILRNIKNKQLKLIDRKENLGYGYSIKQGVDNSESTFIAIIDADGSYPIDKVINLYHECLNGDYDMVIGSRTGKNVEYSKIRAIPKFFSKALC